MKHIFLLFFFLLTPLSAQNVKDVFSIVVEGKLSDLKYIKKRSELSMSRSHKYCRGIKMPKANSIWQCQDYKLLRSRCVQEYKCRSVTRRFNRTSEAKRIRREIRELAPAKGKFKITLVYKPKFVVFNNLGAIIMAPKKEENLLKKKKTSHQVIKSPSPDAHEDEDQEDFNSLFEEELE